MTPLRSAQSINRQLIQRADARRQALDQAIASAEPHPELTDTAAYREAIAARENLVKERGLRKSLDEAYKKSKVTDKDSDPDVVAAKDALAQHRTQAIPGLYKDDPVADPCQRCIAALGRTLTVHLNMLFTLADAPRVVRWIPNHPVPKATVTLAGTSISAASNAFGVAVLTIGPLTGTYMLVVTPPSGQDSKSPAGPALAVADFGTNPPIMLRSFWVQITLDSVGLVATSPTIVASPNTMGVPMHVRVHEADVATLRLDWKPDWVRAAATRRNALNGKRSDYFVLHHTTQMSIGSTLNEFTNPNGKTSAHYLLDRDGHLVKMVHEAEVARHAGWSFWQGHTDLNDLSIGIEIVHADTPAGDPYTEAQYIALLRLIPLIRAAYPTITRTHVIGHSDLRVGEHSYALSVDREQCPGDKFEWERLEAAGHARTARPDPTDTLATIYGGVLALPDAPKQVAKDGPHIAAVKRDLSAIGYSISAKDGKTITEAADHAFGRAIRHFQRRYFAGGRVASRPTLGTLDATTALKIRAVFHDKDP